MSGNYDVASDAARRLQEHAHSEIFVATPLRVLARFARWDQVLRLPPPSPEFRGVVFLWRCVRGVALAREGRVSEAEEERAAMERSYKDLSPGRAFGTFFNDWSAIHTLAAESVDARIAIGRADLLSALGHWRAAVGSQDELNFDDVPEWYYPIRESLGGTPLRLGRSHDAEQFFREDLARNPRTPGRSLDSSSPLRRKNARMRPV